MCVHRKGAVSGREETSSGIALRVIPAGLLGTERDALVGAQRSVVGVVVDVFPVARTRTRVSRGVGVFLQPGSFGSRVIELDIDTFGVGGDLVGARDVVRPLLDDSMLMQSSGERGAARDGAASGVGSAAVVGLEQAGVQVAQRVDALERVPLVAFAEAAAAGGGALLPYLVLFVPVNLGLGFRGPAKRGA